MPLVQNAPLDEELEVEELDEEVDEPPEDELLLVVEDEELDEDDVLDEVLLVEPEHGELFKNTSTLLLLLLVTDRSGLLSLL